MRTRRVCGVAVAVSTLAVLATGALPARPAAAAPAGVPPAPKGSKSAPAQPPAAPARPPGAQPEVVGGTPAAAGQYPFYATIQDAATPLGRALCGGALVSTTQVLTSKQCMDERTPASLRVTIGGLTLTDGLQRSVTAITLADPGENMVANDVALVTLNTPVSRFDSARWLRPAQPGEVGATATVVGHTAPATSLVAATVPVLPDATMSAAFPGAYVPTSMVGAGGGPAGFCRGRDQGDPLLGTAGPQAVLVGAASWNLLCAPGGLPDVYSKLFTGPLASFLASRVSRPANDTFDGATVLGGNAGSVAGSTDNATVDPGETGANDSVWFSWTPTEPGTARVAINQASFDSEVGVFTGSQVSGLSLVAFNDNANGTPQSQVDFPVTAGTTYRIRVDGFAAATQPGRFDFGPFRLSYAVNRQANDDFATAQVFTLSQLPVVATNSRATGQAGEPVTFPGSADASLWFAWTSPCTCTATFSATGLDFVPTLTIVVGTQLTALSLVIATVNGAPASFFATAGTTYRFQISGFNGQRGTFLLR